ncbi:MAG TPA: DUF4870 domain-containing protein [Candidatus Acidoferrales bacterium]|nr:DUF4870 domain-containing protein [Candidatus Acidoferrales bacterium]
MQPQLTTEDRSWADRCDRAEERNWAMGAHLSALIAAVGFPFGNILGPLAVLLFGGNRSPFVAGHAKASLNYQLTISLLGVLASVAALGAVLAFVVAPGIAGESKAGLDAGGLRFLAVWFALGAGFLLVFVLSLVWIVMGAIAAGNGRPYVYPLAIRFLR